MPPSSQAAAVRASTQSAIRIFIVPPMSKTARRFPVRAASQNRSRSVSCADLADELARDEPGKDHESFHEGERDDQRNLDLRGRRRVATDALERRRSRTALAERRAERRDAEREADADRDETGARRVTAVLRERRGGDQQHAGESGEE